jgi:small subunit ribosomal protein S27e
MRKELPRPKSHFMKVKCQDCGNEQPVFNKSQTLVTCLVCGATLSKPDGGLTNIKGEIIGTLDSEKSI